MGRWRGRWRSGLWLAIGLGACAGAGCSHGGHPAPGAPTPEPDEMAAGCAKLDAVAAVLASHAHLESMPEVDDEERWQAEYALAQGYYCLGLYSEALSVFDPGAARAVSPGRMGREIDRAIADANARTETRIADPPTLRLLLAIHRRFPGWRGAENAVAACAPASYDVPALADVRGELLYMAGRAAYSAGQFSRAVDLFGRIPAASPLYVRGKLMQGAVHVREYQAKPTVDAFAEALRAADIDVPPDAARLRDLANISLARVFYSTGQFELAAKYYNRISRESLYWRERLFESGWTEYMRGDYAAAMRDVGALRAEASVRAEVMGDATLLEAAAAFESGDSKRSAGAVAAFNATVPRLYTELKAFLAANPDDGALYARIAPLRHGKADLPPAIEPIAREALADVRLGRRFDDVHELTREIGRVEQLPAPWLGSDLAGDVSADLTARLTTAIKDAGDLCRRRLKRIHEELAQQIRRTIKIDYDPLHGAVSELGRRSAR